MRTTLAIGTIAGVAVSGCSTPLPLSRTAETPIIVQSIQCEIKEAWESYRDSRPWLDKWAAGFTLTLRANRQGGVAPEVSLLGPLAAGTYSVSVGGGVSADATRTAMTKYIVRLDGLKNYTCPARADRPPESYIGLKEWIGSVVSEAPNGLTRVPDTIGHTFQFIASSNARVGPTFSQPRWRGGGIFSISEAHTYILDVAMTDARPKPPQLVIIVEDRTRGGAPPPGRAAETRILSTGVPTQRTSPLLRRGQAVTRGATIPDDARQRIDNQLYELQLRNLLLP
jgi:hypothetical protein